MAKPRPKPKTGDLAVTFDTVREIAQSYPARSKAPPMARPRFAWGKPSSSASTKMASRSSSKSIPTSAAMRMKAEPKTFFITDHYLNYPWILVRLATVTRDDLRDLLEDAWRQSATRNDIASYDRERNQKGASPAPNRPRERKPRLN